MRNQGSQIVLGYYLSTSESKTITSPFIVFYNIYLFWIIQAIFNKKSSIEFLMLTVIFLFPFLDSSVQFSHSLMSDSLDPMNRSMPGLPVHHQLPESTQIHVHWVTDAIQPSHPLSSPYPPAPNPSQHQGLFKWVSSLHQVAKVLDFQLQYQSFQGTPRTDLF